MDEVGLHEETLRLLAMRESLLDQKAFPALHCAFVVQHVSSFRNYNMFYSVVILLLIVCHSELFCHAHIFFILLLSEGYYINIDIVDEDATDGNVRAAKDRQTRTRVVCR